jgi:uncharacterized protein (TIGR03086 family)
MTEIADRYNRLADDFAATIAAVPDDRWGARSPCEDWTARDVVRHVVETQGMFLGFVGRELGAIPSVDEDPAAAFAAARAVVAGDLADPDRAAATFTGFSGESTFEAAVDRFLSGDLLLHRWDLARASGQDVTLAPAEVERQHEVLQGFGEALRSPGAFGPPLEPPAGADAQTRMLAFAGRQAW